MRTDRVTTDLTVADYLAQWLARKEAQRRPATVEQYRRIIRRHIVPALGSTLLQELTPRQVQAWVDGMGPRRVTEYARAVLVGALAEAQRLGLVPDNAAARTEAPARTKPKRPAFTLEECQALFRAAEGERIEPLLRLLLHRFAPGGGPGTEVGGRIVGPAGPDGSPAGNGRQRKGSGA